MRTAAQDALRQPSPTTMRVSTNTLSDPGIGGMQVRQHERCRIRGDGQDEIPAQTTQSDAGPVGHPGIAVLGGAE